MGKSLNFMCVCAKLLQACLTLCDLVACSPPGSSVHGDSPGKNTAVGRQYTSTISSHWLSILYFSDFHLTLKDRLCLSRTLRLLIRVFVWGEWYDPSADSSSVWLILHNVLSWLDRAQCLVIFSGGGGNRSKQELFQTWRPRGQHSSGPTLVIPKSEK